MEGVCYTWILLLLETVKITVSNKVYMMSRAAFLQAMGGK